MSEPLGLIVVACSSCGDAITVSNPREIDEYPLCRRCQEERRAEPPDNRPNRAA